MLKRGYDKRPQVPTPSCSCREPDSATEVLHSNLTFFSLAVWYCVKFSHNLSSSPPGKVRKPKLLLAGGQVRGLMLAPYVSLSDVIGVKKRVFS